MLQQTVCGGPTNNLCVSTFRPVQASHAHICTHLHPTYVHGVVEIMHIQTAVERKWPDLCGWPQYGWGATDLEIYRMWGELKSSGVLMPVQKHTENSHIPVCIFVSPSDSPLIFLYVKTNTSLFIDTWLNCVGECIHVPNTAAVSSFPFFFFF